MKKAILPLLTVFMLLCCTSVTIFSQTKEKAIPTITAHTTGMTKQSGYFPFYWDAKKGNIWLEISDLDSEFLYVNALSAGVGSNDIGLDRGQLGDNRVVKFIRSGHKILLLQPNYSYRAESDNAQERQAVEEAFAQSVLWGFEVEAEEGGRVLIDLTPFLLQDAHDVSGSLKWNKQGSYKLDKSRSAVYLPRTKNFPKNSEFEALLTFTGKADGGYIRQVTPTSSAVTVRQHHSFVQLPDDKYQKRALDPRCGYFGISYSDYATPIDAPLQKRFIMRHRLEKKNPLAAKSEAIEPIVYYLDRGTPEPVFSALKEGAEWWNEAFEAAGFLDAFRVELLPEDADPLDVRYNMIQWVHRATRGWSYGSSVYDPRTGEIIKGHVSLGSLRVRQDYLIAQGLLGFENGADASDEMVQMALARLRQLSAHEVGHTLGIAHNFAASVNNRASVMDYPHPYITVDKSGNLDFSKAYDTSIGEWDKQVVRYGYTQFETGTDEKTALTDIIESGFEKGLLYISDRDARPTGGAHPYAHLWDNGTDAVSEFHRIAGVRKVSLEKFGKNNLQDSMPMANLEEILAPLYLSHRYQIEGVAKLLGGVNYSYAFKNDGQTVTEIVPDEVQKEALDALLTSLKPDFLKMPRHILALIPPKPPAYSKGRESFKSHTGLTFDPFAAAESSVNHTLNYLLHRERAARLVQQPTQVAKIIDFETVLDQLIASTLRKKNKGDMDAEMGRMISKTVLHRLFELAADDKATGQVQAITFLKIKEVQSWVNSKLAKEKGASASELAHFHFLSYQIDQFLETPKEFKPTEAVKMPAGSPIGCEH